MLGERRPKMRCMQLQGWEIRNEMRMRSQKFNVHRHERLQETCKRHDGLFRTRDLQMRTVRLRFQEFPTSQGKVLRLRRLLLQEVTTLSPSVSTDVYLTPSLQDGQQTLLRGRPRNVRVWHVQVLLRVAGRRLSVSGRRSVLHRPTRWRRARLLRTRRLQLWPLRLWDRRILREVLRGVSHVSRTQVRGVTSLRRVLPRRFDELHRAELHHLQVQFCGGGERGCEWEEEDLLFSGWVAVHSCVSVFRFGRPADCWGAKGEGLPRRAWRFRCAI